MDKLCCLPLNDTPELSMNVKCLSTCCVNNVKRKDDIDGCQENDTTIKNNVYEKTFCCCFKRREELPKPQAKEESHEMMETD